MGPRESRVPTSTRRQVVAATLLDCCPLGDEEQPQAAPEVARLTATASQPQVEGDSWKYSRLLDEEQPEARDEPERNEKEIVASLGWVEEFPKGYVDDGHCAPYKVDVPSSQFTLLKAVELRTSSGSHLRLHAFADNDKTWHLRLTDTDRILGFRFHEVQDVTGATRHYNPHVLVQNGTSLEVTLEPLSGHIFWPEPDYPGRIRWMPLSAKPTADQRVETPEVVGLRVMQGQDREGREVHHLIGVKHQSGFSILQMTGQTAMYWVDLLVLTMALFYVDIAFDVKQLILFYQQGLWDYLLINALGMMAPPISTCYAAFAWLQHESREVQHFRRLVPSHAIQVVVLLVLISTQTHMIFLVLFSVVFRGKHPMLESAKAAEVAESLTSGAVQGSFMLSYMAGLDFISSLHVTDEQLQSMVISIGISCASLGLNFASRDKKDRAILGLPGKVGWGPVMLALVMVRAMEVASRLAAFNIIHLSWRSHTLAIGHLGGPAAAAAMCVAAKLSFAKAELPDVLAAVVAHPGQILEPRSVLPLRCSIILHLVLSAAALVSQWQLRRDHAWLADGAKVLPDNFMVAWLATTAGALLGLTILSLAGWYLEQPIFTEFCGKDRCVPFSAVSTAFSSKAAALAAFPDDLVIDLTSEAAVVNLDEEAVQELITAQCALAISESLPSHFWTQLAGARIRTADFFRRFEDGSGLGAEDLLQVLARSEALEELNLRSCQQIPGTAWAKVRGAQWPQLKKADFSECFENQGEGGEHLLEVLARCEALEELNLCYCQQIPGPAWAKVRGAQWPQLKKADFRVCFKDHGEGAEDLLIALGRCHALEAVVFGEQIPASAWQQLPDGCWPKFQLCECGGIPADQLPRLRGQGSTGADAGGLDDAVVAAAGESCHLLAHPSRSTAAHICHVNTPEKASEVVPLLGALRRCPLQELRMPWCRAITAAGWAQFRGAEWTNLRIADFRACIEDQDEGAEDLLQVLGHCKLLEELNLDSCEIPGPAWAKVGGAQWHQLKKANFSCFAVEGEGSEDLLQVLAHCEALEELNLDHCRQIPGPAWAKVRGAQWHQLKKANFYSCFDEQGDGAEDLLQVLAQCKSLEELNLDHCRQIPGPAWAKVRGAQWHQLKKANFYSCFEYQSEGADDLLQVLAQCEAMEELNLRGCQQIPGPAWAKVRGAQWHQLKKADFSECFAFQGEGFEDLLHVLGRCHALEGVDFDRCSKIPKSAWQQLPDGCWPKLGWSPGIPGKQHWRLRGQGSKGAGGEHCQGHGPF